MVTIFLLGLSWGDCAVMSIYLPDSGKGFEMFQSAISCLRRTMKMLATKYGVRRFVWAGDFNTDLHGTNCDLIWPFTTMRFGRDVKRDKFAMKCMRERPQRVELLTCFD